MSDIISSILEIITITGRIFAILNPISVIPTFLSLTSDIPESLRNKITRNSYIAILIMTLLLAFGGNSLLTFFNVDIASIQIGGGILLLAISLEMLGGMPRTKMLESYDEIAIVPIATPLLVGPGTMTTIIVLSATTPILYLVISILISTTLAYLVLRFSSILIGIFGKNGIRAFGRFMSIIIAAFAAQLLYSGITVWIKSWGL
ncbi:MAG: MarC family protein [Candidatus Methanomethyliaceae archaeon]|nr:MarC family protein [Candidatus Methanomethyliaceae archaeon]MDW7971382.1 MarC family protein [Nitrososphaerota archaeon]